MSKNRILSLVLALVMVLGTVGSVFAETATTEAPATYHEKIQWLIDQNILVGDGTGDYDLDSTITRDVLARFITVAEEQEPAAQLLINSPSGFNDIKPGNWANGYAAYVRAENFMVGDQFNNFNASGVVTYEQAIVALTKVALKGLGESTTLPATGMWYTPYVAKATELGLLDDITPVIGANAKKEDILKVLYNVLNNKEYGNYDVLKAIVLENSRVANLGKDEVRIEILEEVQRANFVDASRKVKGEQRVVTLEGFKNVTAENLFGRVADFSFDKKGKLVEVKVDDSYKLVEGALKATSTSLGSYRVEVAEKYKDSDRTIFRTYYNNKDYNYEDYYTTPGAKREDQTKEFTADYVRATVKDGRVLFINAFDFEDIAPVKEIKKDGQEIYVYNDARDGAVKRYELSKRDTVILVNDGVLSAGTYEDIKVDNVIHEYKGGYIVKQDKVVSGKLERVSEDSRGTVYVHVDGKEYEVPTVTLKEAVYEFEENKEFFTLKAKDAWSSLRDFRNEEVRVITDLGGRLQYIGSEVDYGEFVGIATRIVGRDMRVVRDDNKSHDYEANLDTVVGSERTGHQGLNEIKENSLVYVRATDKVLNKVVDLKEVSKEVKKLTSRSIELGGEEYRILDETKVFVIHSNGSVEARELKDVIYAFDNGKKPVEAYVLSDKEYQKETVRGLAGRDSEAHTIVFTKIDMVSATNVSYAKFLGFEDRQETKMNVLRADGTRETVNLGRGIDLKELKLNRDDVYALYQTKTDDKTVTEIKRVLEKDTNVVEVESADRNNIKLTNGEEVYITSKTEFFGKSSLVKGDKISVYSSDNSKYATVILDASRDAGTKPETTDGVVTYINATGTAFAVDGDIYSTNKDTVVKNAAGTVIGLGDALALKQGDVVDVKDNVITRKVSVVVEAAKVDALIEAFSAPATKAEVTAARVAYDALNDYGKALVKAANVTALETAEAALEAADAQGLVDAEAAKLEGETFVDVAAVKAAVPAGIEVTVAITTAPVIGTDGAATVTLTKNGKTATANVVLAKLPRPVLEAPANGATQAENLVNVTEAGAKFHVAGNPALLTLAEVKTYIDTTYDVNFNASAIKLTDSKIEITGSILSTEDWNKIKSSPAADLTKPYRITLVDDTSIPGTKVNVAKIAMYEDGIAVLEIQ